MKIAVVSIGCVVVALMIVYMLSTESVSQFGGIPKCKDPRCIDRCSVVFIFGNRFPADVVVKCW